MSHTSKIRTKPISWELCPHDLGRETWWGDAGVFCITYEVYNDGDKWTWAGHGRYDDSVFSEGSSSTLEEAKRECQEDFAKTIAESLEPTELSESADIAEARVTLRAVRLSLQCIENEVDRGVSKVMSMGRIKVIAAEAKKAIDGCRVARYGRNT